jgi:hypothetical protein
MFFLIFFYLDPALIKTLPTQGKSNRYKYTTKI